MYFDDVSRNAKYTAQWSAQDGKIGSNEVRKNEESMRYARAKMDALNRAFGKYNERQASNLSSDEVQSKMLNWIDKSRVIEGKLLCDSDLMTRKIIVSNSTSPIGCIADFWKSVLAAIEMHQNDPDDRPLFIVFPHTAELYNFQEFQLMNTIINFSQTQCLRLSKDLHAESFHPDYEQRPNTLWSKRHSPFPCIGLRFTSQKEDSYEYKTKWPSRIESITNDLEELFNSPAARPNLEKFTHEMNDMEIVDLFKEWVSLYVDIGESKRFGGSKTNPISSALQNVETIENRWFVSRVVKPEDVFADIWSTIKNLSDSVDAYQQSTDDSTAETQKSSSSMLIFTMFANCNASDFKKVALCTNAALKQIADGKVSMELFHPEYVGKKEIQSKLRRSPFPAILFTHK